MGLPVGLGPARLARVALLDEVLVALGPAEVEHLRKRADARQGMCVCMSGLASLRRMGPSNTTQADGGEDQDAGLSRLRLPAYLGVVAHEGHPMARVHGAAAEVALENPHLAASVNNTLLLCPQRCCSHWGSRGSMCGTKPGFGWGRLDDAGCLCACVSGCLVRVWIVANKCSGRWDWGDGLPGRTAFLGYYPNAAASSTATATTRSRATKPRLVVAPSRRIDAWV